MIPLAEMMKGSYLCSPRIERKTTCFPEKICLLFILVFAFFLRIRQAGLYSYWADDVDYLLLSSDFLSVLTGKTQAVAAPFFLILLKIWQSIFDLHITLLLLPIFISVLSVYFFYYLGATLYDGQTGLLTSFILALSPINIHYSQELKPYTLFIAVVVLSVLFYSRFFVESEVKKNSLYLGLTNAFLLYTHYYGILVIAVENVFLFLHRKKFSHHVRIFFRFNGLSFLLFLPWVLFILYNHLVKMFGYNTTWISEWRFSMIFQTFMRMSAGYHCPRKLGIIISVLFFSFLLYGLYRVYKNRDEVKLLSNQLLLGFFFFPIVITSVGAFFANVYLDRYLVFIIVPLYLLVAHGITMVPSQMFRAVAIIGLSLLFLMPLSFIYLNRIPREDAGIFMRKDVVCCAYFIRNNLQKSDCIISSSCSIIAVLNYYLGERLPQPLVTLKASEFERMGPLIDEAVKYNSYIIPHFLPRVVLNQKKVWLIHTSWPSSIDENRDIKTYMETFYKPLIVKHFHGIELILYSDSDYDVMKTVGIL